MFVIILCSVFKEPETNIEKEDNNCPNQSKLIAVLRVFVRKWLVESLPMSLGLSTLFSL
jgi:hypothetical protein